MQRSRVEKRRSDHGRARPGSCRERAGYIPATAWQLHRGTEAMDEKKECLILTNKATMLLKTKDRVYEQSQTKPISRVGKLVA
jgi:hypothetical protein